MASIFDDLTEESMETFVREVTNLIDDVQAGEFMRVETTDRGVAFRLIQTLKLKEIE